MRIDEAVKQALEEGKCLTNSEFPNVKLQPLSIDEPFIIMDRDGSNPVEYWEVVAADILSDTWEVVD